MTIKEMVERGFSSDKNNKILDEFGNEYRDKNGEVGYLNTFVRPIGSFK